MHKLARSLEILPQWYDYSPTDYIYGLVGKLVTKHHAAHSCATICGGDWNCTWSSRPTASCSHASLSEWATSLLLQNAYDLVSHSPTPTYNGPNGTSIIDHIVCRGASLHVHNVHVSHHSIWEVSDHWPLSISFTPAGWEQEYIPRRFRHKQRITPKADITRPQNEMAPHVERRLTAFRSIITNNLPLPAETTTLRKARSFIQRLTTTTVRAAQKTQRKTTKGYEGWSPEVVALNLAKTTLLEISRRMSGTAKRRRWTSQNQAINGIAHLCKVWEDHLNKVSTLYSTSQAERIRQLIDHGPQYWSTLPHHLLLPAIRAEIKSLGKLLHGRKRAEFQALLRDKDNHREELRRTGRHLTETKKLLDRTPTYWELDELIDKDGRILTDPRSLATQATAHFHDWHNKKPSATFGFHDSSADHHRLLHDCAYFINCHQPTGIPQALLRTIWTSLQAPLADIHARSNRDSLLTADIEALGHTPTFCEFQRTLKATPTHSAPGPSGLTYNMIAALPAPHLRALYDHLVVLWTHREGLQAWKWRELAPLPKVLANITINDIRPLTLIETARKVWVSIFVNRIKHYWNKHSLIHSSQHAYTSRRGVDTVHPQHRNLLEEARETCSSLFYTSWDIKRAFDRVAKPILQASWIRTGIPEDLATYLVNFDTDGYTFVGTPYTRDILSQQGLQGFSLTDDTKAPCFQAQVGTGQGDVASPFNWNSFFDILLRALSTVECTPLYIRSEDHFLHSTEDTGFLCGLQQPAHIPQGRPSTTNVLGPSAPFTT